MATFRHIPTGKRFYFVHIPRTAGRFIETNLMVNNNFAWDDDWEKFGINQVYQKYDGIEFGHWHREYYEKYLDVDDIPHVSIIRNPLTRFKSASTYLKRVYGDDIQSQMEDPILFYSLLRNYPCSESVNWFRPMVDFISNKTHIWKFEDGFKDEFTNWLGGIIGVDLEFDPHIEYRGQTDEHNKLSLSLDLIHNLKELYRQDIEQFYPELAA
jgi:hypothetical protein